MSSKTLKTDFFYIRTELKCMRDSEKAPVKIYFSFINFYKSISNTAIYCFLHSSERY